MDQKALFWLVLIVAVAVFFFGGFANQIFNRESASDIDATQEKEQVEEPAENSVNQEELAGTWRGIDDSKYTLVMETGGTYEEFYDGTRVSGGVWSTFTDITGKGFVEGEFSFASDIYLEKKDGDTGESFYYNIAVASEDELIITYLFGDVFRFERVN
ncbi:MAG: hypothetical protein Q8P99_01550 [bacterium]|nr:hypothetical protein [bacterium]MDZ4231216.1 hypothetical protein [Patescibacteria group bacterium]